MRKISVEEVIYMHSELVKETGGSDGIRDMGLLESAVNAPYQSFGDFELYPTIYHKAARLGFGLAQNHAFIDGNKRIAAHAALVFLRVNGVKIKCTEFELFATFYKLAASEITFDDLLDWIMNHTA